MSIYKQTSPRLFIWRILQVGIFAICPVFCSAATQDAPSTKELRNTLVEFETSLFGQSAVFHYETLTNTESYSEPILVETSTSGDRQKCESTRGRKVFHQGEFVHWQCVEGTCKLGKLNIRAAVQDGELTLSGYTGIQTMAVDFHSPAFAFGYLPSTCSKMSELLDSSSDVSVSMKQGTPVLEFGHPVGDFSLCFEHGPDGDLRLSSVQIELSPGKELRGYHGPVRHFGMGDFVDRKLENTVYGPIVYDDNPNLESGPLFEIPISRTLKTTGGVHKVMNKLSLVSRNPLVSALSDQVSFANISLPDNSRIEIHNHPGLLFELRDGKVVQLVNGKVVNAMGKVTYRSPANKGRLGWYLTSLGVLISGIVALFYFRRQTS